MLKNLLGKILSKVISRFTKVSCDIRKNILILLFNKGKVINLGCGNLKISNALNVDIDEKVKPDLKLDLNKPLPFKDKSFDTAFCFDIIEHLKNPERFVKEVERISERSVWFCLDFDECRENWYADKTHISYMNWEKWKKMFRFPKYFVFKIKSGMVAVKV